MTAIAASTSTPLPALVEFGFPATVFMVAGGVGRENYWETAIGDVSEPMLSRQEMQEMRRAGITFGSHTVNHPHLTSLSAAEVTAEPNDSRARLEEVLGESCLTLAYPYGDWNQPVRDLAERGRLSACLYHRPRRRPPGPTTGWRCRASTSAAITISRALPTSCGRRPRRRA